MCGKEFNKYKSKRKAKAGTGSKTMVFGAVETDGKVVTKVIPETTAESLTNAVEENIQEGAILVSDENKRLQRTKEKISMLK